MKMRAQIHETAPGCKGIKLNRLNNFQALGTGKKVMPLLEIW